MLQGIKGLWGAGTKVLRDGLQIRLGWVGVDITIPALRHLNVEALHSQSELGMGFVHYCWCVFDMAAMETI